MQRAEKRHRWRQYCATAGELPAPNAPLRPCLSRYDVNGDDDAEDDDDGVDDDGVDEPDDDDDGDDKECLSTRSG